MNLRCLKCRLDEILKLDLWLFGGEGGEEKLNLRCLKCRLDEIRNF